jgi:TRAP-type C4-dicarboxylate transport system permease small subunit
MSKIMNWLGSASSWVDKVATWISIIYAFLVTVIVLASVFLRMAGRAPSWSEEFARWLLIGIAFISASVALKRGAHIGITALIKTIPSKTLLRVIIQLSNFLVLVFLVYMFWFGLDAAIKAVDQSGDIIPVSVLYVKLHVPIGALMMIVHVLYCSAGAFSGDDPKNYLLSQ